jgi:hypothetical protein
MQVLFRVSDTGAPKYFYLSIKARALLKSYGLAVRDETDVERLTIHCTLKKDGTAGWFGAPKDLISDVNHDLANIMGLST